LQNQCRLSAELLFNRAIQNSNIIEKALQKSADYLCRIIKPCKDIDNDEEALIKELGGNRYHSALQEKDPMEKYEFGYYPIAQLC